MTKSMQHWNNNQLCAIDCETGGLDSTWHEILQICILPLNSNIEIRKNINPFYILLKPDHPERLDPDALKHNKIKISDLEKHGFDRIQAIDMLEDWIKTLEIGYNKWGHPAKILPLGQNYSFDIAFIKKWLGVSTYDTNFHYHHRDTMITANWLNDSAAFHGEKVPFSKVSLQWLCNKLEVQSERAHDALSDCVSTAAVYKKMLQMGLLFT
jgi:DNA polymerase III epsilon subunit-like protein